MRQHLNKIFIRRETCSAVPFLLNPALFPRQEAVGGRNTAGQSPLELSGRVEDRTGRTAIGTMHLAKGLEFRHVIVMACDANILPDQDRIDTVADEPELDEVFETERRLFYVACTRARENLIVSGVAPASEFFADLKDGNND